MQPKLLFLTGLPRSGTTWLANVIGVHSTFDFISGEVFNPGTSPETFGLEGLPWFLNEEKLTEDIVKNIPKALSLEFNLFFAFKRVVLLVTKLNLKPKNCLRIFKHLWFSLNRKPIFTKDPIGLFMVNYFYKNYDARIVLVKRDPYRFIASMKRMNWYLNFKDLPVEYQKKYKKDISDFEKNQDNSLVYNVLIWWLICEDYCISLKEQGVPFLEIHHEDVLNNPQNGFNKILSYYGVEVDAKVQSKIDYYISQKGSKVKELNETHQMNRSKTQIKNSWKNYLSEPEIALIKSRTNLNPPD